MAPPPLDAALARQLADALAAAFQPSNMAQQPQSRLPQRSPPPQVETTTTPSPPPKVKSCAHPVPAVVAACLKHPRLCPTCTVKCYIKKIQSTQKKLEDRGGYLMSKEKAGHSKIRKHWRDAKLSLMKTVADLEDLIVEKTVSEDVIAAVNPALELFEAHRVQLSRVPGLSYVEGAEEDKPTAEHHETAKLMIELLKLVLEKEMEPGDKAYVADKAFARTRSGEDSVSPSSTTTTSEHPAVLLASPKTPQKVARITHQGTQSSSLPRSAIKRKSSIPSHPSTPTKRICIADNVTVSPSHVIGPTKVDPTQHFLQGPTFVQSDQNQPPTSRPHAVHTSAERCRDKDKFYRSSTLYLPGPWASKAFEEKVNTSKMKVSWDMVLEKEKNFEEKEAKVGKELERVKNLWVGMWWVKNVVAGLDVEKLKEEMEKVVH